MPKIIYGGLLKNRIKHSMIENKYNKRIEKQALIANTIAKKNRFIKKTKPIIYGDLYNKRIAESEKEDIIKRRISQSVYSATNGQRKAAQVLIQGVILPGQVALQNQTPIISAITKEMISEYHEAEKLKPLIIDGEIRKYNKALYQPKITGELESTDKVDRLAVEYNDKKSDIVKTMTDLDNAIIATDEEIRLIKNNPNQYVQTAYELQKRKQKLDDLKNEYKKYNNELNLTNTQIKNLQDARNDIIKHNADISAMNREDVLKFEQALKSANSNRLNVQQEPNESELDYCNRLRAIEREKYDPLLYKQYAENEQTKALKTNLNSLFDNKTFNEEILSKIPAEDKFIINKNFDGIEEAF